MIRAGTPAVRQEFRNPKIGCGSSMSFSGVTAERLDFALRQQGGQRRGQQTTAVERAAQLLQPRGMVDRRADHREVEPLAGADVAEHDLADDAAPGRSAPRARPRRGAHDGSAPAIMRRPPPRRSVARAAVAGRSAGEAIGKIASMPSPMNFRISPPALGDGAAHDGEIVVEQGDDGVARQAVGGAGEAAQVAVPDHRLDGLAVAALDLARQDALAGGAADIGVEQVDRGVAQRMRLDDTREGELQLEHAVEVVCREAARPVRHDAQRIDMAGGEEQRQGDIVGRALGS